MYEIFVVTLAAGLIVALIAYCLSRQLKKPKVGSCNITPQAGYDIEGLDLENDNYTVKKAYGFPTVGNKIFRKLFATQAPFFHFDLTNVSFATIRIQKIFIEVFRYSKGKIYVGKGEMCGGGNENSFECVVKGNVGRYECSMQDRSIDFIKIAPGELEAFEIFIRGMDSGFYEMRPVVEYTHLGRKTELSISSCTFPVIFFDGDPPPDTSFIQPKVKVGGMQRR